MHRTASEEENKRIIMDLDVIIKSYNFPYIVRCLGYFINSVGYQYSVLRHTLYISSSRMFGYVWN
jgi:hypothetical protein